jgi:glycerophosphoryl diester phosphodiesterase
MKIVGHRGAKGLAAENTLDSIAAAMQAGADMIEFDVRVTSDGVPILSHSRFVATQRGTWKISRTTFADLLGVHPGLAKLEATLGLINGQVIPMVEVKAGEPAGPIADILHGFIGDSGSGKAYDRDSIWLGSKSQVTLRELHRLLPNNTLIVIEPWSGVRASWRARQLYGVITDYPDRYKH